MGPFHILLLLLAGIFAAGVVMHSQRALRADWRDEHLLLALICLLSFTYLLIESHQLVTFDTDRYQYWYRVARYLTGTFMFVYPIFVARATGSSMRYEMIVFGSLALIFMWHNTLVPSGPWLTTIDHVERFRLPWGEQVAIPRGAFSNWAFVAFGMWSMVGCYGMLRDFRIRKDGVLGPRALLWTNAIFILVNLHDGLIMERVLHGPFLAYLVPPVLTGGIWWQISLLERRRIESFRSLFVGSGDAILVHDSTNGAVIEANSAACRLFGSQRSELVGATINHLMSTQSALKEAEFFRRVATLRAGGGAIRERQLRRADGSEFVAEIALQLATLEGRERIIASYRDLTDRKRVESALLENEQRLRSVIARSPLAILETTLDGRVLAVNPRFSEAFGDVTTHASILERLLPQGRDEPAEQLRGLPMWREIFARARAQQGVINAFGGTIEDGSGLRRRVDICGVVIGEQVVLFITDLTDILDARDEIARREAFYRVLVDVAADGICVISVEEDDRPVIALWNARMEEITGLSRSQAIANWSATIGGDGFQQLQPLLRRALQDPLRDVEWDLARSDSSHRIVNLSSIDLSRSSGGRRVLLSVRDMTAIKRAERERQDADALVQHAQKLEGLGMLAAGIAHDFNNILIAILGRAGLMAARLGSQHGALGHLHDMEQASKRAGELCQQLLAYAGKGRTRVGAVDLCGMVKETAQMLSVSVSANVHISSGHEEGLPFIHGDVNQVRQVVMNLITNAAEAIGADGGIVTLHLGRRTLVKAEPIAMQGLLAVGSYVVLEVRDSGCGMDEGTRNRMFEPFFTTKPRGRGLGMAAVLGILHGHGGGIQVESLPGHGTTMRAWFPIFIGIPPEKTPAQAVPILLPSGLVLVVDDEASIRRTTRDMLAHLGLQTIEAASGEEAIRLFREQRSRIRAVVLDLTMPGLDGLETLRRLRVIDADIRVLLASGYSRDEVARSLGDQDSAAFLQKPYDIAALTAALNLALDPPSPA